LRNERGERGGIQIRKGLGVGRIGKRTHGRGVWGRRGEEGQRRTNQG